MLRRIGDILPDSSDDCRYNTISHKVPYYENLITSCPECKGKGELDGGKCYCASAFQFVLEMLKSNMPLQHLDILNSKPMHRRVVEIEGEKKVREFEDFNKEFATEFFKKRMFMMNHSCSNLFTGNNESGKTYIALWMMAMFIKSNVSGHYIRFKNYLNLLNSSYNDKDDKRLLKQIREVKFLVLDELGKEHGKAEYATCELEELIKHRQDNLSCTTIITNMDFKDFVGVYGNHVASAINKNYKVLVFHPDAQLRKKTRVQWPI